MTHDHNGQIPEDGPQTLGEALDMIAGMETTLRDQSRRIGRLERELHRYAEAEEMHPKQREITELVRRWSKATGHPNAKVSKDRVDLVKARMKDGYTVEQIALAIDGLASHPYVVNAKRSPTGHPSQRYDKLKHCLSGGEQLEAMANLGARARGRK